MKRLVAAGLVLHGCGAPPSASDGVDASADCVTYHWTRVLAGSGTEASVALDGTIVVVSELHGLRMATVLDAAGNVLGSFSLEAFAAVVRAAPGGGVVAAAADGRVRSFAADGRVRWTAELGHAVADLHARSDGGAIVSTQSDVGLVSHVNYEGRVSSSTTVRVAPFVAEDDSGRLVLTSRDACTIQAPCGTGLDPNQPSPPIATMAGGFQTSAVVVLDRERRTLGGFVSGVNERDPFGPVFVRSGLLGADAIVVHATAVSTEHQRASIDVDPGLPIALREVDTDAAPDHLLGFSGRSLVWARGFEPLDASGRAYIVGMFANVQGVVVDVNGDVYGTHHILLFGPDGTLRLRYDKPNDGIANDVRLAGMDGRGRIVLSGRFEGTQDFDPGVGTDRFSADGDARRYVTALSACE